MKPNGRQRSCYRRSLPGEPMLWRIGRNGFEMIEKSRVGDHDKWQTESGVPKGWINHYKKDELIVTASSERGIAYLASVLKHVQTRYPKAKIKSLTKPGGWEAIN